MADTAAVTQEKSTIVFWIWRSLSYQKRLLLSVGCIIAGFAVQFLMLPRLSSYPNFVSIIAIEDWVFLASEFFRFALSAIMPGAVLIFFGNLLLLVRGYDNRVKVGKFSAASAWEKVDPGKMYEVEYLDLKMKKWDRALIDISNAPGCLIFLIVFGGIVGMFVIGFTRSNFGLLVLASDVVLLLIPHWWTGKRSILTKPNLLLKVKLLRKLLEDTKEQLQDHEVDIFMLLAGKESKMPEDVKFRVQVPNHHPDFLGMYGQLVLNNVSGTNYPYFYVVLVAKQGYGLKESFRSYAPPVPGFWGGGVNLTKEFKIEGDVEVFVLRQTTTRTSGYHTKPNAIRKIFAEGLQVAETAAVKA